MSPVEFNREIYENCGTYAGFQAHIRKKTLTCEPCKKANRDYGRARRHNIGESKGTWVYIPDSEPEALDQIKQMLGANFRIMGAAA